MVKRYYTEDEIVIQPLPSHGKLQDRTGSSHGMTVVIGYAGKASRYHKWFVKCHCGNIICTFQGSLKTMKSCGCDRIKKATRHGMSYSHEYRIYCNAKYRCNNQKCHAYSLYGGRGVRFLFDSFCDFFNHVGPRPSKHHQIDRIDNNGHYEPGNIRWASSKENNNNRTRSIRITMNDTTHTISEWCDILKLNLSYVRERIRKGWCHTCALTIPALKKFTKKPQCPHSE